MSLEEEEDYIKNLTELNPNIKRKENYNNVYDYSCRTLKFELYINDLNITHLPQIPDLTQDFDCSHNKIKYLCDLKEIEVLDCSYNEIKKLPYINKELGDLNCSHNKISKFPLFCEYNFQRTFDLSFNSINKLPCFDIKKSFECNLFNNKFLYKAKCILNVESENILKYQSSWAIFNDKCKYFIYFSKNQLIYIF